MDNVLDRRERTLFVSTIQKCITEDDLYNLFSLAGPIEKVSFKLNLDCSPMHALIVFRNVESITYAMERLQGFVLNDQAIHMRPLRESSHQVAQPSSASRFGRSRAWSTGPFSGSSDGVFRENFSGTNDFRTCSRSVNIPKLMEVNPHMAKYAEMFSPPLLSPANSSLDGSAFRAPGLFTGNLPEYRSNSTSTDSWSNPNTPDLLSPPTSAGFLGFCADGNSRGQHTAFPFFADETLKSNIPNVGHPVGYECDRKAVPLSNIRKDGGKSIDMTYHFPCPPHSSRNYGNSNSTDYSRRSASQDTFNMPPSKLYNPRTRNMLHAVNGDGFASWAASNRNEEFHRGPTRF